MAQRTLKFFNSLQKNAPIAIIFQLVSDLALRVGLIVIVQERAALLVHARVLDPARLLRESRASQDILEPFCRHSTQAI